MNTLIFAVAQSIASKGNVEQNIKGHLKLIEHAAKHKAALIVFPELSLTGYEPSLANELAFTHRDDRLIPLVEASKEHNMILVIGAPLKDQPGLFIASIIIYPDGNITFYTKHFLHPGEENVFIAGKENQVINVDEEKISFAICADMTHKSHAAVASSNQSSIYIVSAFITPQGYKNDSMLLQSYAREFSMTVFLANYGAPSGGLDSAGKSAIWGDEGELIGELPAKGEGLLIASKKKGRWFVNALPLDSMEKL